MKPAPALFNPDFEFEDGDRRLLADPSFDFVPYDAQVQRLQKSALQEARRARRHNFTMPPAFWIVEPGDVVAWTSERNGYSDKQFRVDGATDQANLDVLLNITEVDPSDYEWDHAVDFTPVTTGPTVLSRPAAQGVIDWFAEPYTLIDADGQPRRAAIRLSWDGDMPGVVGVQYEVRLASSAVVVTRGRTDQLAAGAIIVSQSLIPDTAYEARGQYIPSSPREMLWSDWLPVTTPDVSVSLADFDAALQYQVIAIQDSLKAELDDLNQRISTLTSMLAAQEYTDVVSVRSQLSSRSLAAFAAIDHVQTVSTAADAALASDILTVSTQVNDPTTGLPATRASTVANATAISGVLGSLSSYQTIVSAAATYATLTGLSTTNANVTTNATAIATINGYASSKYSVTLDVNGYATGFTLLNGGGGISSATFVQNKFQIAAPGVAGGTPVPIFTVANVNGVPKIAIRSDMYVDGSITALMMNVATLTAISAHFGNATVDGAITSTNGKMLLDFTTGRMVLSD